MIKSNQTNWLPSVLDEMFKTDWMGGTANSNNFGARIPPVNIQETEDFFKLEVAAPGKIRKDFHIELDNEILTISSEEKDEKETQDNGRYTRREFSYNNFKRIFSLPETVNGEQISASYESGILTINLPKKEEAKIPPKRMIEIS